MGFLAKGSRKAVVAREDWTLLVIAASDGLHPVQLQKALFRFAQRSPEATGKGFYEFRPVAGGDFSEQIYADVHEFAKKGLVSIRYADEDGSRRYRLTTAGVERSTNVEKLVDPALSRSLRSVVSWVQKRSIEQLLNGSAETTGSIRFGSESRDPSRPR